ncbi:alpha/beta-hydrolase [Hymenopellis radicata]|nr:alpha/beta-hydrolase [Hymenopellis radicata]
MVDLGYANYRGIWDPTFSNNTQFLGIRYAASPTATYNKCLYPALEDAQAQPPQCRQAGLGRANGKGGRIEMPPFGIPGLPESEDCLFLNVYVPGQIDASKRLPVIVWIHGGGFVLGSIQSVAGFSFYNGDDLIHGMQQVEGGEDGAVVVLLQYRLGMFGFLAGKEVKEDGALNAGLLDQQFALRWIQEHIVKFGGDPSRVTIWGQSAGAQSVLEHVIANNGQTSPPLFKRGITSSTAILTQYRYDDSIPEGHYADVLREAKLMPDLKCLRKLPEEKLAEINKEVASRGFFGSFVFVPVVDGSFITQSPSQALKERKVNGEGILVMTNSDEGTVFANPALGPLDFYIKSHFPHLSEEQALSAAALFKGLDQPFSSVLADTMFDCPALSLLDAFPGRAYKGLFAVPPAFHGQDGTYYFFSQATDPRASPYRNPEFQRAFTAPLFYFILNGNPGRVDDLGLKAYWDVLYGTLFDTHAAPRWEAYHYDDDVRALHGGVQMLFNHTEDGAPVVKSVRTDAKLIERCRFWDSVAAETGR